MPIRLAHIVGRKLGIIAALVLGGAFLLLPPLHWFASVVPLQTELRECSNDALLLAAHLYDPNFTTAERADTLQQLLRLLLTAPERERPYRGSPGFVDSLGLYSALRAPRTAAQGDLHARGAPDNTAGALRGSAVSAAVAGNMLFCADHWACAAAPPLLGSEAAAGGAAPPERATVARAAGFAPRPGSICRP
jgi:hypothetical protein